MAGKVLIALSTFSDAASARQIAEQLVKGRLAACANILPPMQSIYRWQGKVEKADEVLVVFKLSEERQAEFQEKLRSIHPYDVPEIIFIPVTSGLPEYLKWVSESCS